MPVKKDAVTISHTQAQYEKQLQFLYARRSAIEAVIQSLQQYERYRSPAPSAPKTDTDLGPDLFPEHVLDLRR
jgi:hypothetical protein